MATLQEVRDDLDALRASVVEANAKMDLIMVLVEQLRAGGGGVTPQDLDNLRVMVADVAAVVNDLKAKEDIVLA